MTADGAAALLIEAVLFLLSDGGVRVPGRARPGGKRSRSRCEPVILAGMALIVTQATDAKLSKLIG